MERLSFTLEYLFSQKMSCLLRRHPKALKLQCLKNVTTRRNVITTSQSQNLVFDQRQRIHHLDISSTRKDAHVYDYIKDHVAKEFCDRIDDLKLDSEQLILNLGSCSGLITKNLNPDRVESFIQADVSEKSLSRCRKTDSMLPPKFPIHYMRCDEENIPLRENSIDLVMSCLNLHWVNDLVRCFRNVHNILSDDKAFIGVLFGGDTLYELRSALQLAELERLSGFSSHVSPKTTGQDVARLLQSCGFQLITVDISEVKIHYPSAFELMFDLQGMGENNKSLLGSRHMHRDILQAAASIYQVLYGSDDPKKGVPATFQAIHFIGWKNPTKATPLKSE
uniref:Arginine-hydroxylase NDUFAF5, mitochondrial n=1 Tax=Aceria tosichella TaxID=561515 RepID=A0A6G1S553_9ACAR